ncbi:MAG: hypothetical protein RIA69_07460 [Cyclobacteriaceae bacterium]
MKILLTLIAVLISLSNPAEIARSNKLKELAKESFERGDYQEAIKNYSFLIDSMGVDEKELFLNRAHSYYLAGDTAKAKPDYQNATASNSSKLRSLAHQQLGVMAKDKNKLEESLAHLKSSLKNDPTNEQARYDYEVVKRLANEQKEQEQDQEGEDNKDQQDQEKSDEQKEQDQENKQDQENQQDQEGDEGEQDQQNQEQKDQDQEGEQDQEQQKEGEEKKEGEEEQQQGEESKEEGEENKEAPKPSTQQKLEDMNISEEKARMILEAMQNNEIQYIQQQRRKPTKPIDSDKPDW